MKTSANAASTNTTSNNVHERKKEDNLTTYVPRIVRYGKRVFDVLFSIFAILCLLPITPFVAIAIKLDTKGPVFYLQQRLGRSQHGKHNIFNIIKFRTMGTDAEKEGVALLATKADPRITRVGRFLRKTRLDETPQFINVLIGDMSVIGPRPERPQLTEEIDNKMPFFSERNYQVLPGLTGLAQINQSYLDSVDDIDQKLAFDHAYSLAISKPSTWISMEISILIKTVLTVLKCNG